MEVVKFKAFCIERYKFAFGLTGSETLRLFMKYGVMDYIESFFDVLHSFGDKHLINDINEFIDVRKKRLP